MIKQSMSQPVSACLSQPAQPIRLQLSTGCPNESMLKQHTFHPPDPPMISGFGCLFFIRFGLVWFWLSFRKWCKSGGTNSASIKKQNWRQNFTWISLFSRSEWHCQPKNKRSQIFSSWVARGPFQCDKTFKSSAVLATEQFRRILFVCLEWVIS